MINLARGLACACLLAGCAHVPDATMVYRLAATEVRFRVVRTVSCDHDNRPIVATAVTPGTRHAADMTAQYAFALASIQGALSDTDMTFAFYADRRIKSINATSTGNVAPVLKTALSLAGGVAALGGAGTADACASVAAAGNKKPLTLVYEGEVRTDVPGAQAIAPEPASAVYAADARITSLVHAVCAVVETTTPGLVPVARPSTNAPSITAREPGLATIRIAVSTVAGQCDAAPLWRDTIPVAQSGQLYQLPVPRAALFGKQAFAASFAESGALIEVQYAAGGGPGAAMTALASAAATQRDDTAHQADEVKARADLIHQQQRLVACLADPAHCE